MFAVFGKSRVKARTKAIDAIGELNKQTRKPYTLEEYTEALEKRAEEYFEGMRPAKISPMYGNYSEAEEYREMVEKAGTSDLLTIKHRVANGVNEKTGKTMLKWA